MPNHDRNVTPSTTGSSQQNRTENGTESLPDRLAEIRADAAQNEQRVISRDVERGSNDPCGCDDDECGYWAEWYPVPFHEGVLFRNAPADIAWLLDELEAARASAERYHKQLVSIGRFDA